MTTSARLIRLAIFALVVLTSTLSVRGQATTKAPGSFDFDANGIVFQTGDTSNRVIMRFRMQNQAVVRTVSEEDFSLGSTEWLVRRLRLRFGGHLVDPRLTFNLQLSFARGDLDLADTQFPNIIRDAMVFWNFSPDLQIGFGQTKLPGNRQRVISSGDLQFGERSLVNNAFNFDRDFGFQGFWRLHPVGTIVNLRGALSTGDGRNQGRIAGDGLAWTGRVEWLPLGAFTNGGDYFEGDLARERSPKLSIGASFQHNSNHTRTRGELGPRLYQPRTSEVIYLDAIAKWQGFAVYGEWAQRSSDDPITVNAAGDRLAVLVGSGWMFQSSYIFPFGMEVGARMSTVMADDRLSGLADGQDMRDVSGVVNYYARGHRIKGGLELGQEQRTPLATSRTTRNWFGRINVEFGI